VEPHPLRTGAKLSSVLSSTFRHSRSKRLSIGRGLKNFGDAGALPPWDGMWLTPRNVLPTCVTMLDSVILDQTIRA